jgi:dihydroorotase
VHLRDGATLRSVVGFTARQFARAIVMPNLNPPVTTTELARVYRERIMAALEPGQRFEPLMTLYLTDNTPTSEIERAKDSGIVAGCKLYPAGATTNSDSGVTDVARLDATLARMAELGLPLQVHGEVTRGDIDVFEREARFIEEILAPLIARHPRLKVVFEHITTAQAVRFVRAARAGVAATITPQHLLHNRNALFEGGLRPHFYCLPVLKTESDRAALLGAATSGEPRFFLGTDSAPHARHAKESDCACAGIFSAHAAMELYAEAFESVRALERLQGFASEFGPDFYGLPRNRESIELVKSPWSPPARYAMGPDELVPMWAGRLLGWRLA